MLTQPRSLPRPAGRTTPGRRTARRSFVAALVLAVALPAAASAIPPGGPQENRNGATITVGADVVQPGSLVSYTGSGFTAGETLTIKVDDGLVLPVLASRPEAPAGANPSVPYTADAFAQVVADASGNVSGTVNLAIAQPAFAAELASGKHLLRFVTSAPAPRSVHVDFAVSSTLPAPVVGSGATAVIGPAADLPVDYMANHPYDDIPKLRAGSVVPYRLTGFSPNQTLSIKINDGAIKPPGTPDNGVVGTVTTDASGNAAGTIAVPTDTIGTFWLRFLASGRSVYAPYAVVADTGDIQVTQSVLPGTSVGFSGTGLLRSPIDYWPLDNDGGQTVSARLDGTGTPITLKASNGALAGAVPLPADIPLGTHTVTFFVGFTAQNDGPQKVVTRTFTVVSELPKDPTPTTPTTPTPVQTCPTRPRFNSVIYADGVTSFYYRPQPGQKILGARRLGTKTLTTRLATAKGRSTLPRLEYTTAKVVDARKLPWFARKVGPRRVVTAIMSNADSSAYSGVRLVYRPKNGTYAKLILPNGNVQRLISSCPPVTGYKTIYAQNIVVNRRSK